MKLKSLIFQTTLSLCNDQNSITLVLGISGVDFISVSTWMWAHF